MQLDTSRLQFLARLARTPDGRFLVESILEPMLDEADGKLRTARGEDIFRAQGAATSLADLIAAIRNAEKQLDRVAQTSNRGPRAA